MAGSRKNDDCLFISCTVPLTEQTLPYCYLWTYHTLDSKVNSLFMMVSGAIQRMGMREPSAWTAYSLRHKYLPTLKSGEGEVKGKMEWSLNKP